MATAGLITLAGLTRSEITNYDSKKQRRRQEREAGIEFEGLELAIQRLQDEFPRIDQEIDKGDWAQAIESAMNSIPEENRSIMRTLVLSILTHETGFRSKPRLINDLPFPNEEFVLVNYFKEDKTTGPMEVNVNYLASELGISQTDARTWLTNGSSMVFSVWSGTDILNRLYEAYKYEGLDEEQLIKVISADYSSGPNSSWRAGIQQSLLEEGYLEDVETDGSF